MEEIGHTLNSYFWTGEEKLLITLGYCKNKKGQTTSDKVQGLVMNLPFLLYPVYKMLGFSSAFSFGLGALPLSLYCLGVGSLFLSLSNALHSHAWTVWRGKREEAAPTQIKVMHLNACMFPGSLPYHFGKQVPASERLDLLGEKIKTKNPDLLFLSEMGQIFSRSLYNKIKENYHLFIVNVGSISFGIDADLYCASKVKIEKVDFIQSQIPRIGDQKWMNRGYLIIETNAIKYIYTHLHPKDSEEAKEVRRRQIEEEILPIMKEGDKPSLLIGDLNIDRNTDEYQVITAHFDDLVENLITCQEGEVKESIDYFLTLKGDNRLTVNPVEVDLDLDLSDHATLTTKSNSRLL